MSEGLSPGQLQQLSDALEVGKIADDKLSPDRTFLRGWNSGLEFIENHLLKIMKEGANDGASGR